MSRAHVGCSCKGKRWIINERNGKDCANCKISDANDVTG